jgi:hypothetical protein
MVTIACNCCGKKIENASLERNFRSVLGRDVCRECYRKLSDRAEVLAVSKGSYSFAGYKEALAAALRKMCK